MRERNLGPRNKKRVVLYSQSTSHTFKSRQACLFKALFSLAHFGSLHFSIWFRPCKPSFIVKVKRAISSCDRPLIQSWQALLSASVRFIIFLSSHKICVCANFLQIWKACYLKGEETESGMLKQLYAACSETLLPAIIFASYFPHLTGRWKVSILVTVQFSERISLSNLILRGRGRRIINF